MTAASSELWFTAPVRDLAPDGRVVLFCLPHAGGASSAFRGWAEALAPGVEGLVLQLPGRERRIREPVEIDPPVIAAAVADALAARGLPGYGFYGHSLGARLAFAVTRELRKLGAPMPARLYVGASRPPEFPLPPDLRGLSEITDEMVAQRLVRLGGIPDGVFEYPELVTLVMRVIRADFNWLETYEFQPEPPIPVPIIGFAGSEDQIASPSDMAGWVHHTSAGLTMRHVNAGHLFVERLREQLTGFIRTDLPAAASASSTSAGG